MLIENFSEANIGPNSIDLTLAEIYKMKKSQIDLSNDSLPEYEKVSLEKPYSLKPREYVLGKTKENINMPSNLVGFLFSKSTSFRIGLDIKCGLLDSNYKGEIVFGIKNISKNGIFLRKGMRLLQLTVTNVKGETIPLISKYMYGKVI